MPQSNFLGRLPCRTPAVAAFVVLTTGLLAHGIVALPYASDTAPDAPAAAGPGQPLSAIGVLGKRIFFDASLSQSGRMSCATCHSPAHAYGPPNGLAVQLGGPKLDRQGT